MVWKYMPNREIHVTALRDALSYGGDKTVNELAEIIGVNRSSVRIALDSNPDVFMRVRRFSPYTYRLRDGGNGMETLKFDTNKVQEAIDLDVLDELIWLETFLRFGGNQEFCETMCKEAEKEIKKLWKTVQENPDAKPNWAQLVVIVVEAPKPGKVKACHWQQRVSV